MNFIVIFIILSLLTYLIGSINFSIILFKLLGKEDPRDSHSGNAGTTNVYRQAGLSWAIVVFILDIARSIGIAYAALKFLRIELVTWAALFLLFGNRFPCFHGFKGGKGVANYLGFSIIVSPYAALLSAMNWVIIYLIIKIPFIASFFMIFVLTVGIPITVGLNAISISGAIACFAFIIYNHKQNIIEMKGK